MSKIYDIEITVGKKANEIVLNAIRSNDFKKKFTIIDNGDNNHIIRTKNSYELECLITTGFEIILISIEKSYLIEQSHELKELIDILLKNSFSEKYHYEINRSEIVVKKGILTRNNITTAINLQNNEK